MPKSPKRLVADPDQTARFIEAARELGCDESPDAFEAVVRKVARHRRVEEKSDGKPQKSTDKPS